MTTPTIIVNPIGFPNAVSSSYARTALTAFNAISSSYTTTSTSTVSASYAQVATSALTADSATSASYSLTASYAQSSSNAIASISSSYAATASLTLSSSITLITSSSYSQNATSASYAQSASYAADINNILYHDLTITGSLLTSGTLVQYGNQIVTGSLATSGSNTLIGLTILTGSIYGSGSNLFYGDQTVTGSLRTSGSNALLGNTILSGTLNIEGQYPPQAGSESVSIVGNVDLNGYLRFDPVTSNIYSPLSASYIYVSGSENELFFTQNRKGSRMDVELTFFANQLYTGLLYGAILRQLTSGTFEISSGSGYFVNFNNSYTEHNAPIITQIEWPNLVGDVSPYTASYDLTYIALGSASNIVYSPGTPFTDGGCDCDIPVGVVIHQMHTGISAVKTVASPAYGWKQRSSIFTRAFGPLKISGFAMAQSGSSTGSITIGAGTAFADGVNYPIDSNNPSYITDVGTNVCKIFRYRQSGSSWVYDTNNGVGYGAIDPTKYSNNGVLTTVPAGNFSIQRVYWFPNSPVKAIFVYYGNAQYNTIAIAESNLDIEAFTESPVTSTNSVYIGALILRANADFNTAASFAILPAGLFRNAGAGGSGGTAVTLALNGLSDVSITNLAHKDILRYDSSSAHWINAPSASLATSASYALSASYSVSSSYVSHVSIGAASGSAGGTYTSAEQNLINQMRQALIALGALS